MLVKNNLYSFPGYLLFLILSFQVKNNFAQDSIKYFRDTKKIYLNTNFSSSGFQEKIPTGGSNYVVGITINSKLGIFILPRTGVGIKGNYNFTYSNIYPAPPFRFYGVFIDYYPLKKYNLYFTTDYKI